MRTMMRRLGVAVAVLLACATAIVPSCGSMGGGMKYFAPDIPWSTTALA